MKDRWCETCVKRKTIYCPNSDKCFEKEEKPYYQDKIMLLEENQKLKSTLELYKGSLHREHEAIHRANDLEEENQELKNQQKEFIEYLENEIMEIRAKWGNALSNVSQLDVAMTVKAYEDILSKYKEIIGGDNNE